MDRDTRWKPSLESIVLAARAGGDQALRLLPEASIAVEKPGGDFATNADIQAQETILRSLSAAYPLIPIIAEEDDGSAHAASLARGSFFTVDPLDGTIVASRGSDQWGTLIAYIENGIPDLAVMYQPAKERLITAERGKGCFYTDVKCREPRKLYLPERSTSQIVLGYETSFAFSQEQIERTLFPLLRNNRIAIVRAAGAAINAGFELALGLIDAYINVVGAKIWDFAPLVLAAEECGGSALSLDSGTLATTPFTCDRIYSGAIIARSRSLAADIASLIAA